MKLFRVFPANRGGPTKSSILINRVFHYFHHPFWRTPIFGNTLHLMFDFYCLGFSNGPLPPKKTWCFWTNGHVNVFKQQCTLKSVLTDLYWLQPVIFLLFLVVSSATKKRKPHVFVYVLYMKISPNSEEKTFHNFFTHFPKNNEKMSRKRSIFNHIVKKHKVDYLTRILSN